MTTDNLTNLTAYALAATLAGMTEAELAAIIDNRPLMFELGPKADAVWAAWSELGRAAAAKKAEGEAMLERILTSGTAQQLNAWLADEPVEAFDDAAPAPATAAPVRVKGGRVVFNLGRTVAAHLACVAEAMPDDLTFTVYKTTVRVSATATGAAYLDGYLHEAIDAEQLVDDLNLTEAQWAFAHKAAQRAYKAACATLSAAVNAIA